MIPTDVKFHTSDSLWQSVYDAAEAKARVNLRKVLGRQVLIEGGAYPHLWLETQPMGGEMYASRNMEAGLNNQLMFMENIREDGRLPSVIAFDEGGIRNLSFRHFQGYCFPYHALNLYYLNGKDREYLEQLYDVLERFDAYLWRHRDSDGDGCLETWCIWDTGEDESTRFFGGPNAWPGEKAPYGQARLPYESMDIMSYSCDGRQTLAEISDILWPGGDRSDSWRKKAQTVREKIRSYLWRDTHGACYDRDCNNQFLDTLVHNNLRCMYHGSFDRYMAGRFVGEHLLNPDEFWTPMPLPSIAANDPLFYSDHNNNWSGQPEGLTYQRAIRALENYGYFPLIPILGHKLCHSIGTLSSNMRFNQQTDPFTMIPSERDDGMSDGCYGPTILAFLEYTNRMYGVKILRDQLLWSCEAGDYESEYTQFWGDHAFTLKCGKRMCEALIDNRIAWKAAKGTRTLTDINGNILSRDLL